MTDDVARCVICGAEVAWTVEGVTFAGIQAVSGFAVEPGMAHDLCAEAPEVLQRWLSGAEEMVIDLNPAPVDELADWLRSGGQLSELAALALLDELDTERRRNGKR